jgi:hypothetical protein
VSPRFRLAATISVTAALALLIAWWRFHRAPAGPVSFVYTGPTYLTHDGAWDRMLDFLHVRSEIPEPVENLAALFTAEKAWYGEYDPYVTDLKSVNWRPSGTSRYLYGFCRPFPKPGGTGAKWLATLVPGFDPECRTTADACLLAGGGYSNAQSFDPCAELAAYGLDAEFVQDAQSRFEAFAVRKNGAELEVWSIDQFKEIRRLR